MTPFKLCSILARSISFLALSYALWWEWARPGACLRERTNSSLLSDCYAAGRVSCLTRCHAHLKLVDIGPRSNRGVIATVRSRRESERIHFVTLLPLARLLNPFKIKSRTIWPLNRIAGGKSAKGYYRSQFEAVWQAYCPEDGTASQPNNIRALRAA